MAENKIELKSINDLLGMNFFIPSYQRGYRWTDQQVKDLLEDIDSFIPKEIPNTNDKTWYCLQPVVIKAKNEQWEVIDGQQRLTTIYLILHYLNQGYVETRRRKLFGLEYETRNTEQSNSKEFLSNVENKTEQDALANIDYFHIAQAYKTVKDWFDEKGNNYDSNGFESKFLNNTQVIWYETNEKDAVQIFTRINMGKIPLTNAELIKALFLQKKNFGNDDKRVQLQQINIASEWDFIEYSLHNDEFWLFINKDENEKDTRIEFLFELIVGKSDNKEDDTYTFRKYSGKFKNKSEKEIEENWKEVKRHFQTLQDWFDNRELYHKVGYLITNGEDIKGLLDESRKMDKTDFLSFINGKIENSLSNINLDDLEKKDDAKVRKVLLLHNIQTMLDNKVENTKFPFYRYKKKTQDNKGWDVEHIHAIATKVPEKPDQQEDWLKYAKDLLFSKLEIEKKTDDSKLDDEKKSKRQNTIDEIEKLMGTQYNANNFENSFTEILKYIGDEDVNDLSNLALLDLGTNRGYKNEFFSYKRDVIIEKDKTNTFVPICTKNAFMKYYTQTDKIEQMTFWGETDRTAYLKDIKKVLKWYLPKQRG